MGRPVPDRRGSDTPDSGERRRRDDDMIERLSAWMEAHDDWAREMSTELRTRMTAVESRADLLDGRAGNDGGIIGILGELKGSVEKMEGRQERQANAISEMKAALAGVQTDVRDVKTKTGAEDGQKPVSRWQRSVEIAIPIIVASLPVIGTIVAAYLAFKGQVASLGGK